MVMVAPRPHMTSDMTRGQFSQLASAGYQLSFHEPAWEPALGPMCVMDVRLA